MHNTISRFILLRNAALGLSALAVLVLSANTLVCAAEPSLSVDLGSSTDLTTSETNLVNAIEARGPIKVTVENIPPAPNDWTWKLRIGSGRVVESPITGDDPAIHKLQAPLPHGPVRLDIELWENDEIRHSAYYDLNVDTRGPELIDHYVTGDPKIGLMLNLVFREGDFAEISNTNFTFHDEDTKASGTSFGKAYAENNIIRIPLDRPKHGTYRVTIKGKDSADALKDKAGNLFGGGEDKDITFTTTPRSEPGQHVEFPRFVPARQTLPDEFNPGDFVETRVARLYYFRDAHRVAQIINRTAHPHRAAEVAQAERRAADARERANSATDERRDTEMRAEEVGRRLRSAEQRLGQAQSLLNDALRKQAAASGPNTEPEDGGDEGDAPPEVSQALPATAPTSEQITALRNSVASLRQEVNGLQQQAADLRLQTQQHQAKEDRAREHQFRLEVASAKEDPDTYAAAKLDSPDPVSQVSVSVIGEGLIQLRGPIAGINKIRTMIDQIDSPLGQVRVDVITVQLNGERGERLEEPVARVNGYVDLGRFLTSQSLALLRRAIQSEAARLASQAQMEFGGHYQVDRDRRYLYSFFGRDFIDELYEMDSEFLHTENKLLSLHAMDTVSLNQALFILSLARRDVRANILAMFQASIQEELPQAEWDYRRSAGLVDKPRHPLIAKFKKKHHPLEPQCIEQVYFNAMQKYHFRNFTAMFDGNDAYSGDGDIMTPMQREFIRLAQIFTARMVAEVELKQRVIERGLIESKRQASFNEEEVVRQDLRDKVIKITKSIQDEGIEVAESLVVASTEFNASIRENVTSLVEFIHLTSSMYGNIAESLKSFDGNIDAELSRLEALDDDQLAAEVEKVTQKVLQPIIDLAQQAEKNLTIIQERVAEIDIDEQLQSLGKKLTSTKFSIHEKDAYEARGILDEYLHPDNGLQENLYLIANRLDENRSKMESVAELFLQSINPASEAKSKISDRMANAKRYHSVLRQQISKALPKTRRSRITTVLDNTYRTGVDFLNTLAKKEVADYYLQQTRISVDHKKLLDFLIDEREDKFIELQEGTRAHIAWMDNYLKRLAIALEDDFKVQFYEPAFVRIRQNARTRFVTLSQIERTSILTNNRAFAKVSPQATMEFDLPKRKLALVEAFDAAKAVAQDAGALLNDPTFLATFQMMGGGPVGTTVQGVIPSLPSSTDQAIMGITADNPLEIGSALQALVPPPAIYKFETGTGYEIRPVIQPDGHSVMFDFLYMYTTNIREPVGGDEKHLGRVRRHFIDTQVQLSSFEMRELSRYQVALKVARTAQGVPLLQDIPLIGVAFRPLPSKDSSIQQNVILGQSVVYPTLFDLMGLRWAPAVIDLNHTELKNLNHVVRGRNRAMEDAVFRISSESVDEMLDLSRRSPQHLRPDLYHQQRNPSPYHPNGFEYEPRNPAFDDPTGRDFEIPDRRPVEFQTPPYDSRFRRPIRYESMPPNEYTPQLREAADGNVVTPQRIDGNLPESVRQPAYDGKPSDQTINDPPRELLINPGGAEEMR